MRNLLQFKRKHSIKIIYIFLIISFVFGAACQTEKVAQNDTPPGLFVVKSPADGIITKVLANEGANVGKDAGIVEIEIVSEIQTAPIDKNLTKSAENDLQQIENQIKTAEQEVKRTSVEVERVQSLIMSNSAPQAQLDAARADFQKAQELLENLEEKQRNQKTQSLIDKTEGSKNSSSTTIEQEQIVFARVSEAGILKVINARVGQKVKKGQPLATVEKN